jgi:8-oxo-dGTP pyrophosphatase MutT (NUDIX family)/phage portal protein BeeE
MRSLLPRRAGGRHRQAIDRATLTDYWSWVKTSMQFGGHTYGLGAAGINTSYGKTPAEPIGNSYEGYAVGLLFADGPVSAVEAFRLRVFAQAPPLFQTRQPNGRPGDLYDDDSLDLLLTPWPGGTCSDLMKRALIHGDLGGNAYIVEIDGELVLLRPDWVEIILAPRYDRGKQCGFKQVGIAYYEGGVNTADPAIFLVGEYAHFVPGMPDPLASYRGMSWMTPVIREVQSDKSATDHAGKFFENAATPNLAVSLPKELTTHQFKAFVEMMDARSKGSDHAYETLYTGGGADVTVIGANMQQMNTTGFQGKIETRIANAGGVPPTLLNFSEGMQGSSLNAGNYTPAKRSFVDTTGRDLWGNWYGSMQVLVPPPNQRDRLTYDPRDIPFLHEDQKDVAEIKAAEASTMNTLVTAGWDKTSIIKAVIAGDWTMLVDTGLVSVQLLPPGTTADSAKEPSGGPPDTAGRSRTFPDDADLDDTDPDSLTLDAEEQALFDALALLDEAGRARWDPSVHPRGPDGRFINVGALLADAIRQHRAGHTSVDPFDSFSRERLRRVAIRRGVPIPRGATRDDIKLRLLGSIAQPTGRPLPQLPHQVVPRAPGLTPPTTQQSVEQTRALEAVFDTSLSYDQQLVRFENLSKDGFEKMDAVDRNMVLGQLETIRTKTTSAGTAKRASDAIDKLDPTYAANAQAAAGVPKALPNLRNRRGRIDNAMAVIQDPNSGAPAEIAAIDRLHLVDFQTMAPPDRQLVLSRLSVIAGSTSMPGTSADARKLLDRFNPAGTPVNVGVNAPAVVPSQPVIIPTGASADQTRFPAPVVGMLAVKPASQRGTSGDGWTTNPDGSRGPWGQHGAAGLLLRHTDDKGVSRFLMVQRGTGISDPGKWQFPGGAIDQHETPANGAAREVVEELGFKQDALLAARVHGYHENKIPSGWKYTSFAADVDTQMQADLSTHHARLETADAKWMTLDEIDALDKQGVLLKPLQKGALHKNVTSLFPPAKPGTPAPAPPKVRHKGSKGTNLIPDRASEDALRARVSADRKTYRGKTADERLAAIGAMQGYDAPPTVVKRDEMDRLLATGDYIEAWRGVQGTWGGKSAAQIHEDMRTGPAYYGTGIFGNGYYLTTQKSVAQRYSDGSQGSVIRVLIPKSAKFEEFTDVYRRSQTTSSSSGSRFSGGRQGDFGGATLRNPGRYAAAVGLDGIEITTASRSPGGGANHVSKPGKPSFTWQNRSVLIVQEEAG